MCHSYQKETLTANLETSWNISPIQKAPNRVHQEILGFMFKNIANERSTSMTICGLISRLWACNYLLKRSSGIHPWRAAGKII